MLLSQIELVELTVDGGDGKMLGRKADIGVSGIDFVANHLNSS